MIQKYPFLIRIKIGREIGIGKGVLRALRCPKSLLFWWAEGENVLLISAANGEEDCSLLIPDSQLTKRNGVRVSNSHLLKKISTLTGWEQGSERRLAGEFIPELDMVAFRINDAASEVI